jgi:prephenate dehydratase
LDPGLKPGFFVLLIIKKMTAIPKKETKKVAIQGGYGAFHEIAAKHYFQNDHIEIITANTFKDLFKSLRMNHADLGIMAIENSLAGSILPNYGLLQESNMKIIGEIYLRIKQNLVALPGQKIEDIKEVFSHPMAILQCQLFFNNYPHIKLIDSIDTALSAKEIHDNQLKGTAAIASKLAADKYNLEILQESIETNKMNYTRFLILADKKGIHKPGPSINKASIYFALAHEIGSLSKILSIFSFYNINLTKIQSMPIMGKDWEYQFYVDVTFKDYKIYHQAIDAVRPFTSDLGIMGEYEKGNTVYE